MQGVFILDSLIFATEPRGADQPLGFEVCITGTRLMESSLVCFAFGWVLRSRRTQGITAYGFEPRESLLVGPD